MDQLRLYRGLAGLCRDAAALIDQHAPPAPLWAGLRRLILSAAALLDAAA